MKCKNILVLGGIMCLLTGCQDKEVMVLTPYGDAVIKDEGSSSMTKDTTKQSTQEENEANQGGR